MKKIFNPLFIFLFVVLPQLLSIGYAALSFGVSNMSTLTLPIIITLSCSLCFAIYAYIKRNEKIISTKVFTIISLVYTLFIIGAGIYALEAIAPRSFISPTLLFISACMISVFYGIIGATYHSTPPGKTYAAVKYVVAIIIVPLIWFLTVNLIGGINSNSVTITLIVACAYAMIFFAAKILFIWRLDNASLAIDTHPSKKYYIATFIIAFCMPLGGLALNQGFADMGNDSFSAGLFGDFSHPFFYAIAALNGILLLIPPMKNRELRILLFYLKSVGYSYILYFFIVFLPSLPLVFIGIIFYGLGIFILSPTMVAVLQGYHLVKEWTVLSKSWNKRQLVALFCIGMITFPVLMSATFWGDQANFSVATQYLQYEDSNISEVVNLTRLQRTLKNIKGNLQVTRGDLGFSRGNTPIVSAAYTHFVLNGKLISQDNVLRLENLFFDTGHDLATLNLSDPAIVDDRVGLLDANSKTRFDEKSGVYKSWVNLKLENYSDSSNGEYRTEFKLPEGAYISDYYLDVLGTRKEGILTDRRAALFIYRKIVNARLDPGLLHYIGKNTLELRVFPFAPKEIRETGFEIIHSQKFTLTLGDKIISLDGDPAQKEIALNGAILLPSNQKIHLQPVVRTPEYYFVIDSSKNSNVVWHIGQVQEYAKSHNIIAANVIFASYKLQTHTLSDMEQAPYKAESGFNLNRAVHMILNKENTNTFPIIIVVSDNMPKAVFPQNTDVLSDKFPESPYFYGLNHNLSLKPYSFEDNRSESTVDDPIVAPILDYNGIYVLDNGESELVLTGTPDDVFVSTGNQYQDAILLDAMRRRELLAGKTDSLKLIRASFRTRILTPQTAFIVVETQEQEKELLDLQEQILNNKGDTPTITLDEPSLLLCILLLLLMVVIIKRKKNKSLT